MLPVFLVGKFLVICNGQRAAEYLGHLVAAFKRVRLPVWNGRIDDLRAPLHAIRDAVHEAPPPCFSPWLIRVKQAINSLQFLERLRPAVTVAHAPEGIGGRG